MTNCLHFLVTGKVQGVWFRAHTQKKALELGITGLVKNLPDGSVEVLACGDTTQLKALEKWLWQGPTLAKVEKVEIFAIAWEKFEGFMII